MNCQIIHDSIHVRPGWTIEYALDLAGSLVGYGSVAVAGPWTKAHALYEFYVTRDGRRQVFDLFAALLATCDAATIETQTNDPFLTVMLHTFAQGVRAEAILFEDRFETRVYAEGLRFSRNRSRRCGAVEKL